VSSVLFYGRVKYAEPFCYPYYDRPWFISAQTGAGKTNFVFNTIYRICKDWKRVCWSWPHVQP
jgi:late competence protein required for DNA uptake (superfamily II DNA/RNA helicase)